MAIFNCTPDAMNLVNEPIKTFSHTYYFSFSSGDRIRSRTKLREVYNEPIKCINSFVGYQVDTKTNMVLRN